MIDPARDRIKLYEIMALIAGLAVGLWLMMPLQASNPSEWFIPATLPLGGLSLAGLPLLLIERQGSRRHKAFGAGRLLWFTHGMNALLLWPPTIYLKVRHPSIDGAGMAQACFYYAAPLLSLFLLPALVIGGWFGRRRRRRMTSWRERFGVGLTLAWAAIGLYVLGSFYVADCVASRPLGGRVAMKIGMNLLLWTDMVKPEHDSLLDGIKALGFDSVEVPIFDTSDLTPYKRLGDRLKSLGLGATAVTVMTPETNPISPDKAIRDAAVAHLDRVLECAQQFGCEILCGPTHSAIGVFSGNGPTEEEFKAGVETLQRAGEKAQARDIMIATEYLNRFEIYFLTTAAQASRFIKTVNHPYVKMMYDSFHAHIEEKGQAAAIKLCASETIHVHVSENDRGVPGTGQVDWDGYFGAFKETGYDGYFTIEAFGRALPALAAATKVWRDLFPDAMGLCRDGIAFIKSKAGK